MIEERTPRPSPEIIMVGDYVLKSGNNYGFNTSFYRVTRVSDDELAFENPTTHEGEKGDWSRATCRRAEPLIFLRPTERGTLEVIAASLGFNEQLHRLTENHPDEY